MDIYQSMHPIYDIYKDSPIKFNFHVLSLCHTYTSEEHASCAYTQKLVKFMEMYKNSGHKIYHYGNEGSVVPEGVEHIQILSEKERNGFGFSGVFNTATANGIRWDPNEPYWKLFGSRCSEHLTKRVQRGDLILHVAGGYDCYQHALVNFPGCNRYGTTNAMFVDIGCGHHGVGSTDYMVYETSVWEEHLNGQLNNDSVKWGETAIPNYFDLKDFRFGKDPEEDDERILAIQKEPYYLFLGRIVEDKGWKIAVEATRHIRAKLVIAGQGELELPSQVDNVIHFGFADLKQRKSLMAGAVAVFVPTQYREPFGGVNIEAQLSGVPAITSDYAGFRELVDDKYRCVTMREYIEVAKYCATLTEEERREIQRKAQNKYSLAAVKPLYDRYFHRLHMLWHSGFYEMREWKDLPQLRS